ncbi:MAG: transcriptional repressor NrdR [Firmicutes bacterium]|uniref:Transcriptional repressor NrdR n=1 Tax=Candidatus Gallilactobacillus intestinavium TaxID=2840838 RepID=A0A9D9E688_9LACO|nr:transcriptional repressor NrdR [Candidatus Gallilactobacillus intestinavium]
MQCPSCHFSDTKVIDSRPTDDGQAIRRRRECTNCHFRFTTFERVENTTLLVIKKNGTREAFNRNKILQGIIRAAEKRPLSMPDINHMVERIEKKAYSLGESEVSSKIIGTYVMEELAKADGISYIRFASVHREFKDLNVFLKEVQEEINKSNK